MSGRLQSDPEHPNFNFKNESMLQVIRTCSRKYGGLGTNLSHCNKITQTANKNEYAHELTQVVELWQSWQLS